MRDVNAPPVLNPLKFFVRYVAIGFLICLAVLIVGIPLELAGIGILWLLGY